MPLTPRLSCGPLTSRPVHSEPHDPVPAPRLPIAVLHLDESCLGNGRTVQIPAAQAPDEVAPSGIQRRDLYLRPDTTTTRWRSVAQSRLQLLGGMLAARAGDLIPNTGEGRPRMGARMESERLDPEGRYH